MADQEQDSSKPATYAGLYSFFATRERFFIVIAAYFTLHFIIRTMLGGAATLDEAEQLFHGQELSLGYGPQPPLYTWLQILVFTVTGTNILSLALLKNALLCCTYTLAYLNGRMISGRHSGGVVAALSLLFIPQIAWESQRDLTHSVLASTLALATLAVFLKACSTRHWTWFLLLGTAIGGGILAKYNYALWAAGLMGAAILTPHFRQHALHRGMILTLLTAILIALPHAIWAIAYRDLALASSFKLGMAHSGNWLGIRALGFGKLLVAAVAFLLPLAIMYAAILFRRRGHRTRLPFPIPEEALVGGALLIIAATISIGILVSGATVFRDRWFQPILICVPVVAASRFTDLLDPNGLRWLQRLAIMVMLTVLMLIPGKVLFADITGRDEYINHPYSHLAWEMRPVIQRDTILVADTKMVAGNMRLEFLKNRIQLMENGVPPAGDWVLVWDARHRVRPPIKPRMWLAAAGQEPQFLRAQFRYQPNQIFRLGMLRSSQDGLR